MVWIIFGLTRAGLRPVETPKGVTDSIGQAGKNKKPVVTSQTFCPDFVSHDPAPDEEGISCLPLVRNGFTRTSSFGRQVTPLLEAVLCTADGLLPKGAPSQAHFTWSGELKSLANISASLLVIRRKWRDWIISRF